MKNTLKIFLLAMLCCLTFAARTLAQTPAYKEIHIGDKLPDITLSGFLDDTARQVKLSSMYNHKLLIIDFWATWCSACLDEFPKFDALKKEFGDRIQLLAVGYEPYPKISQFLKLRPRFNTGNYTVMTGETVLTQQLFPHKLLPHLVWVDASGTVTAITEGDDVNSNNIAKALKHLPVDALVKKDNMNLSAADIFKPFHLMDSAFQSRSIFTGYVNGMLSFEGIQGVRNRPDSCNRVFDGNLTIAEMYIHAVFNHQISGVNFSRIIFELRDSLKYMPPERVAQGLAHSKYKSRTQWERQNSYCYDLVLPYYTRDTVLCHYMINDLNRYLNLNGRFELRERDAYILKYEPTSAKSEPVDSALFKTNGKKLVGFHRGSLKQLVVFMNRYIRDGTVVDETGLDGNKQLDVDIFKQTFSGADLNKLIHSYGFRLEQGKRKIKVFVVSEK